MTFRAILLGNEAIAHEMAESGCTPAASCAGTPASEEIVRVFLDFPPSNPSPVPVPTIFYEHTREDQVRIVVGYDLRTSGASFRPGSERFGARTAPMGPARVETLCRMFKNMQSTVFYAAASMGSPHDRCTP
ncbi:MAG: hypothetical protein KBH99_09165 [Syntrophobacteraceae bacterium]|nr:hypothetical protein [Syntrophobacteraceae bacterium]